MDDTPTLPFPIDTPVIFFDLEATGTDPGSARIIQIALWEFIPSTNNEPILNRRFSRLVNPKTPLPGHVTELTGITEQDVASAPPFEIYAPDINQWMKGATLAGYNIAKYDVPLLTKELQRAGESPNWTDHTDILDVYLLEKAVQSRTLEGIYQKYTGEALEDAHEAESDVRATIRVLAHQIMSHNLNVHLDTLIDVQTGDYIDLHQRLKETDDGRVIVCFGKYDGESLEEVYSKDRDYFRWMYREIDNLRPHLDEWKSSR